MKTQFAPFFGQANIARAYEIAITGGYRIALIRYDENTEKAIVDEQDPVIAMFISHMGNSTATGGSYQQRELNHLIIEIPKIDFNELFLTRHMETIEDVRKRANQTIVRHRPNDGEAICVRPFEPYDINETCVQLLKTAYDRLSFTPNDVKKILDVAYTIAAMECDYGKIEVKVEHVAEAIQYRCINRDLWK